MTEKKLKRIIIFIAMILGVILILFSGYVENHAEYQGTMKLMLGLYCIGTPVIGVGMISAFKRKSRK